MKTITIKSQSEWDALPQSFDTQTWIEIRSENEVVIRHTPDSSTVRACDSSTVRACDSSTVTACDSSTVTACDSSTVTAYGSSTVRACDSSTVRAYDSSTVTACDSSTVRAYDSSTVTACDSVAIHVHSPSAIVTLLAFAVAILKAKAKVTRKSKTSTVVEVKSPTTAKAWCENGGADVDGGFATLFKRVSSDFKTQEETENETLWAVGLTVEHKAWDPAERECGAGKFHACAAPHFCDQYRDKKGDRYVAIKVAIKDMFLWKNNPEHPNKIAFRKGVVLHECDIHGRKLEGVQ